MNRHAFRSALGRGTPTTTARALTLPVSTTTPTTFSSFFSTTGPRPSDDPPNNNNNNNNNNSSSSKPRSQSAAVSRLSQLNTSRRSDSPGGFGGSGGGPSSSSSPFRSGGQGGVDARSLRVSPGGGPTSSSSSSSSSSGPRVLNIRSLRGGIRGRMPFGRGGGVGGRFAPGAPGAGPRRVGFGFGGGGGGGGGAGGRVVLGSGGFKGGSGRFGGFKGRGGGQNGRRGGRFQRGRGRGGGDGKPREARGGKLVWEPEEQAVIDRLEKGEVVPFDPKLTMDSLTGYGAAMATDASIGQVETVLRTMRLMTGGMAFNSDSGVTADVKQVMKRYRAKKPIFVHSKEEKAWIESAQPRLKLVGPDAGTKKAIIEPAVLGKYQSAGFAETSDVAGTMANYHSRTFTYMAADSQKFMDKVLSLLPAERGGKPASQAKP